MPRMPRIAGFAPCCIPPAIQMSPEEEVQRWKQHRAVDSYLHSCNGCGCWGYYGREPMPDRCRLKYIDLGRYNYAFLCSWCEADYRWRESQRDHFIECCKFTGFGPNDWFCCTVCGRWGYFPGKEVPEYYLLSLSPTWTYRFELLCQRCNR